MVLVLRACTLRPLTGQDLANRALGEPSLWHWWWGAQPMAQYL